MGHPTTCFSSHSNVFDFFLPEKVTEAVLVREMQAPVYDWDWLSGSGGVKAPRAVMVSSRCGEDPSHWVNTGDVSKGPSKSSIYLSEILHAREILSPNSYYLSTPPSRLILMLMNVDVITSTI